ncbi:Uncharacterised protein [Escherichia coli]|nr:hypothetical protein [Escherichia coli]SQD00392.1 Uncharacterised protein [Escherichia coli]
MTQLVRAIATKKAEIRQLIMSSLRTHLEHLTQTLVDGRDNSLTKHWARINKIQKENGGQLIARDSQYSVGRKVKYANGKSPAQPVLNAVPTATQQPIEVAQHAQAVKKPQKTGNQPQPINPENADV